MNVTTQQLAELLIGIARSQQAIIDAIDAQKAGFKGTYLSPALDSVAKIRSTNRAPTLQEFPARVLLQCQSRTGPNPEQVIKDPEVKKKFGELGFFTTGSTPEAYLEKLKAETVRWTKVVKDNDIKVEG